MPYHCSYYHRVAAQWLALLLDIYALLIFHMQQVGFGEDFKASRDIDNTVNNTFRLISDDLEELIRRVVMPLRRFARGKVQTWIAGFFKPLT